MPSIPSAVNTLNCCKRSRALGVINNYLNSRITTQVDKKLSYRRDTARHATSVEILSTAAQLYEKSHSKRPAIGE